MKFLQQQFHAWLLRLAADDWQRQTLTWRAANLQPEDLRRLTQTPKRMWKKRAEIPGLILEKGANLFMKNGKHPEP